MKNEEKLLALQTELEIQKERLRQASYDALDALKRDFSPRLWVYQYPWLSAGTLFVAGFVIGWQIHVTRRRKPRLRERYLRPVPGPIPKVPDTEPESAATIIQVGESS